MWLRVNGLRGEQAEPALRAMLERLYEDATSFGFPEERFERIYQEVEVTLYHSAVHARVVAPLRGAAMAAERVDLGGGVALVRGDLADAPPEAVWPDPLEDGLGGEPAVLCVLERDAPAGDGIPAAEAAERFRTLVTALRLWAPGAVGVGAPAWRRADEGRWQPLPLGVGGDIGGGEGWYLPAGEEEGLAEFFAAVDAADPPRTVAWALGRFEMGCARGKDAARVRTGDDAPRELVAEMEAHLRALLRDVLCGYLDADLKGVADDILLETTPEPFMEIRARDLRAEAREAAPPGGAPPVREPRFERPPPPPEPELEPERDTSEMPAAEPELQGVTASADWSWDDPEDFSAPV